MKKTLLVALLTVGVVASALSQGTVIFNNVNSSAGLRAPVYGVNPDAPTVALSGNTATGLPAGTQNYGTAPLLTGTGYSAQLWAAVGAGAAEGSLLGALNPTTSFRAAGATAGFLTGITSTLQGVPGDTAAATLQVRVWDNAGGTITSYDAATTKGKSALFNVNAIGGALNPSPLLTGLTSFNLTGTSVIVPEPSSFALAGLGAAALLIFRRRK